MLPLLRVAVTRRVVLAWSYNSSLVICSNKWMPSMQLRQVQ